MSAEEASPYWRATTWTTWRGGTRTPRRSRDHRFDDRLPDLSGAAFAAERRALDGSAARLAAIGTTALTAELRVDATMLSESIARRVFELDELREHTWNPLLANPGSAIYDLLARDFAPLPDRLASVAGRLAEIPAVLEAGRASLGAMPKVHIETAITQFSGTINLVTNEIDAALRKAGGPAVVDAAGLPRSRRSARTSTGCPRSSPARRWATSPIRGLVPSASRASCP